MEAVRATPIYVIDHGVHSGIMIRRNDLDAPRLLAAFPDAQWFEIGWGDAEFYQATPSFADFDLWLGARAALWPTPSALHVVGFDRAPEAIFLPEILMRLEIDVGGARALSRFVRETLPDGPLRALGPGLYGPSVFLEAAPSYHLFNVCNHWTSDALNIAGLPSTRFWSTFSAGLMAELKLRRA